ncbi:MAG: M48 family metalloprotease [Candidatus Sericytochromatia bacterium]|uniref:M48 family metalloprotease n=1 Tax=Candidatus Tanganyikabacteria bacterium TaxID=2961651 RepID=A0A937X475_9BACT|nr:M48 family metalloprotease [Candidatus Tanganyikabacteria bacterium]
MTTTSTDFPKLSRVAFQHPEDVKALETLQGFKGLDIVCHKLIEFGFERMMYIQSVASDLKVGPKQLPRVHALVRDACWTLDVAEPTVFVAETPGMNAWALGVEKPFIVLTRGLVQNLSEAELRTVIAHEVAHIKCGHMLYITLARFLSVAATGIADATLGIGGIVAMSLRLALANWMRVAELSCDRAGQLVNRDSDVSVSTLMKLSGASAGERTDLDVAAFLAQAEEFDAMDNDGLNKLYKIIMTLDRSHPYTAVRAREILAWSKSEDYEKILAGEYVKEDPADPEPVPEWLKKIQNAADNASPAAASGLKAAEQAAAAAGNAAADGIKVLTEVAGKAGEAALDLLGAGFKALSEAVAKAGQDAPATTGSVKVEVEVGAEFKPCPSCAELIRQAAAKCRFCGEVFAEDPAESPPDASPDKTLG